MSVFLSANKTRGSALDRIEAVFDRPKRILLVDDDHWFVELFQRRSERYEVILDVASSLADAKKYFEFSNPDGIILDYSLSNGDGIDLYKELVISNPTLPVIFLSGYGSMVREKVEAVGPARVYSKESFGNPDFIPTLFAQLRIRKKP
jgi:ActR/RegA family two-component response regulator